MEHEEPLPGGNASGDVVRVGATVRKAWTPSTASVVEYVKSLRASGVDLPDVYGRDEQGRQIIEFVPGRLAMQRGALSQEELRRVGTMVREIHDASASITPPASAHWSVLLEPSGATLICHNDLAPWNLITGDRWVFIDWDGAGPSTRLWDLAYAAQTFSLNDAGRPPDAAARDLVALIDGYGADELLRTQLPRAMSERTGAMHELLRSSHDSGREPWGTMYVTGHGEHWRDVTRYVRQHEEIWTVALLSGVI